MKFWQIVKTWAENNPLIKLLALVVAVALWFLASGWVYEISTLQVPVTLKLAEGMTEVGINPPRVVVRLEYPREYQTLIEGGELPIKVVHDLSETRTAGRVVFNLDPSDVERASHLRVVGIDPARVIADIDRLAEKALPVKVNYRGKPGRGSRLTGQRVIPPEVVVPGPESVLRDMSAIETEPINIMGRELDFYQRVDLKPITPYFEHGLEPVSVNVFIRQEPARREFSDVEVGILRGSQGVARVRYEPGTVALTLSGPATALDSMTVDDLTAYVDIIGLKPGVYDLPLRTNLPGGVVLARAEPAVIKVTIESGLGELLEP